MYTVNMSSHEREPVTRERIIGAAIRVADTEGVDALSMRRLGRELGVEAMALYNHVANKDAILDGVVEVVLAKITVPSPDDDWKEAMRTRAASAREVFLRHPWAMGILESRPQNSSPQRLGYYDAVLGALRNAGFGSRLAMRAFSILDAYIFGFILQEQSIAFDNDDDSLQEIGEDLLRQMADAYPHLSAATTDAMTEGYDYSAEFEFGLDLILEALERQRDAT
jgi:AcrR family transcriptional regulator